VVIFIFGGVVTPGDIPSELQLVSDATAASSRTALILGFVLNKI
jgi:hypothetical protein